MEQEWVYPLFKGLLKVMEAISRLKLSQEDDRRNNGKGNDGRVSFRFKFLKVQFFSHHG